MQITNGDLMANNEDTSQMNQYRKPENHDNDNKLDACQDAYRKPKMVKKELHPMKG